MNTYTSEHNDFNDTLYSSSVITKEVPYTIELPAVTNRQSVMIVQRVIDLVISMLLLLTLLPVFMAIAVWIKFDSPGPVLFKQVRVGHNGQEFNMYKFRSMVVDAEEKRKELERLNERNGPVFKIKNDPRITISGRILRRYSLDELPQLINVLLGEMSLIGPRPALPKEVDKYTPYQRQRLLVKPGLTGLWQVSGRAKLSFDHSIDLDLYYIRNMSLKLNMQILYKTFSVVIRGDGAY